MKNKINLSCIINKFSKKVPVTITSYKNELLKGKIALITGGSGGIGFGIAKSFVSSGAKVILIGTNEESLKKNVTILGENCSKYLLLNLDDTSQLEQTILKALNLFQEKRIDILVNAAGVHGNKLFLDVDEESYNQTLNINLKSTFFMSQCVCKYMIKDKIKGHILNVSSASALKPAWTPYEISKWGIRGFTLGLADEMIKHGIVVNAIAPGPVATKMINRDEKDGIESAGNPAGRIATIDEIGDLAVIMVSDLGNLIVGDSFYISGGSGTIKMHNN